MRRDEKSEKIVRPSSRERNDTYRKGNAQQTCGTPHQFEFTFKHRMCGLENEGSGILPIDSNRNYLEE